MPKKSKKKSKVKNSEKPDLNPDDFHDIDFAAVARKLMESGPPKKGR